ncbi:MAG TPA: SGNH/GDSL hydrolase family protein [Baekduia sp.]|uniref:SGNH/GDSL hydrolase family protein n=1 Tax=Baekduia sp. TaxID=2600305 RepID=UPI002C6F4F55|nr:SGNH/GDSL hydrolase family protein [Baekduia sp.]HMJ33458.1 SGNH/GDSL hydrolase family protein [Baekduia sp.]
MTATPGYRDLSWSDRLAARLALGRPGATLFNLGRRDLTAAEVRWTQLETALSLGPELAIVLAGGNDLLRGELDVDALQDELVAIVGPLREAGADVLTMDLFDITISGHVPERFVAVMSRRLAQLAELTREVSEAAGGLHVPLRAHPAAADPGLFSTDGLHLNARGHAIVATALARHLGAVRRRARARARAAEAA